MRLLLHMCCGPCATATLDHWAGDGADVTGFFHNPNIHPLLEFRRRVTGVRDLALARRVHVIEDLAYDPSAWFREIVGEDASGRCGRCIASRLRATARVAAASGYDAFSTTLAISPWQDHEAIREGGGSAQQEHHVEFIYRDLRAAYPDSRRAAREAGLYRQKYCGCLLSEWERYREK
ncbi:MAG TPA: epoxyqueuosine reductase QueH [Thermoleophilia bacterium]|nr:epoxyqueuosine reductase QueH [Thermoleophilia bacterium]